MAGVPPGLIILVPYEHVRLNIDFICKVFATVFGLAWVLHAVLVVDFAVDVSSEQKVVVLEDVLVVAPMVGLLRVRLAIQEDELLTVWEKVALRSHTKADLRVVVDQSVPRIPWH